MIRKTTNAFLTKSWRDILASCLVIISTFVVLFTIVGAMTKSYFVLFMVDGIYLLALGGYILLFTGKSVSETLKRWMLFFSIVGAAISILLMWSFFAFHI